MYVSCANSDIPRTYLRVAELWRLDESAQSLTLAGGYYSVHRRFGETSRNLSFPTGQGLIGRCAKSMTPILLDELSPDSGFMRVEVAKAEGLGLGLALPIGGLSGNKGVLALFFSRNGNAPSGGVEVWGLDVESEALRLRFAHHGVSEDFRRVSTQLSFPLGVGLPGRIAQRQTPELLNELSDPSEFLRVIAAETSGFNHAIGLPVDGIEGAAVVLLGHHAQPLALRAELWRSAPGVEFAPIAVQRATPEASIVFDRLPWLRRAERLREPVVFSFLEPNAPDMPRGGLILPYFPTEQSCLACTLIW